MKKEEIIEACRDELLKQLHPMLHTNGYPSEAVPKGTILELPALMSHSKLLFGLKDKINDEAIKICPYKGENYKNCKKWQKFKNGCAECDYIWEY